MLSNSARLGLKSLARYHSENGVGFSNQGDLCCLAKSYFQQLYSKNDVDINGTFGLVQRNISDDDNALLLAPFEKTKFRDVIFHMHLDKSPTLMELIPLFTKKLGLARR